MKTEKERYLADGRGGGGGEGAKSARKPGPLKIIQYSLDKTQEVKKGILSQTF